MVSFFRPYFGMIAEVGLSLLLGIAGGVVQFVLALFIAFFFWFSGERLGEKFSAVIHRIAGPYADRLIARDGAGGARDGVRPAGPRPSCRGC